MEWVLRELTQKDALLDLFIVNTVDLINEVEIGSCLGHSNHKVIKFEISVGRQVKCQQNLSSINKESRCQAAQGINK